MVLIWGFFGNPFFDVVYTVRKLSGKWSFSVKSGKSQEKSGKVGESRGKSGEVGETCNGQWKIAFSCCRPGREFHSSSSKKYFDLLVHILLLSFGLS